MTRRRRPISKTASDLTCAPSAVTYAAFLRGCAHFDAHELALSALSEMLGERQPRERGAGRRRAADDAADPLAPQRNSSADVKRLMPGVLEGILEWLKMYKTTDGKAVNALASDVPKEPAAALAVIGECHESWKALKARGAALLVGERDFRAFCAPGGRKCGSTVRRLRAVDVEFLEAAELPFVGRVRGLLRIAFDGDGFLKHQCRKMVGALVRLGTGALSEAQVAAALADPRGAHPAVSSPRFAAPARGLWQERVDTAWDEAEHPR